MRTVKNLIEWMLVVTLCGLPCLIAAEKPAQQFEEQRKAADAAKREAAEAKKQQPSKEQLARAKLPVDNTARISVKEVRFSGNTLVSSAEMLANMPIIFNASDKPLDKADSENLYDFTTLREILQKPGEIREVSARTIAGLTQYVLSIYQQKNYGGIYVYVPADTLKGGAELTDGILPVNILEARVSGVGVKYYDVNQSVVQKGHLDANAVLSWSPARQGKVLNRKDLDDFVNLLNLNPDRYVNAVVSKGGEANTLAVDYGIYEANPWHWFAQVDNSGVKGRRWNPMIGVINTNLLGLDDSFFAMYQFSPDSDWQDNYSLFGSYDIPIAGPKLRLNIYGGYSEFDLTPQQGDISFVGGGSFIGANLRYNVLQCHGWFFDFIGSISEEKSRFTPSLFPEFTSSNVRMDLWGLAADIHKRDDMSNSSLGYKYTASMGGSDEEQFTKARTDAQRDFAIHTVSAMHSRYIDPNKVNRLSGTFRWIQTDDRLVPAKMTPFGGMYSVRGYKEYEMLADEGVLASVQYEFDIIRYEKTKGVSKEEADKSKSKVFGLKKFAPLAFLDLGRARINGAVGDEKEHETFVSIGPGVLVELGDNFSGAFYYGIPLRKTEQTNAGDGRVNIGLMARW